MINHKPVTKIFKINKIKIPIMFANIGYLLSKKIKRIEINFKKVTIAKNQVDLINYHLYHFKV